MKGHSNININAGGTASGHGVNPPVNESHTQSGKAAISAPAEKYINLYLDDVSTLRALATELLQQYNALIDLPAADLLAWQKEARRRRSLPENVRVQ
jgi:hypothetical protein